MKLKGRKKKLKGTKEKIKGRKERIPPQSIGGERFKLLQKLRYEIRLQGGVEGLLESRRTAFRHQNEENQRYSNLSENRAEVNAKIFLKIRAVFEGKKV